MTTQTQHPETPHLDPSLREIEAGVVRSLEAAGSLLTSFDRSKLGDFRKTGYDIVTEADLTVEALLREELGAVVPGADFCSEESTPPVPREASWNWVVDPLDGTVNFAAGLPTYAVTVALRKGSLVLVCATLVPELRLCFTASADGAFLNGCAIAPSARTELANSVIGVTLTSNGSMEVRARSLSLIKALAGRCRGVRIITSTALELGWTAAGRLDGFVCLEADTYSATAGAAMVRFAGGVVSAWRDEIRVDGVAPIIAAAPGIHASLASAVAPFLHPANPVHANSTIKA
jgi:myo-inositol-1(or 4)-monophosphatase